MCSPPVCGGERAREERRLASSLSLGVSHLFDTHLLSARRPSYKEPTSPVGDNNTIEIGVPYSQEEEMAGRLHAELERMKKHGSSAQLNQTATAA